MMKKEIAELEAAIQENLEASKAVFDSEVRKKKARYRLIKAREAVYYKSQELLEDVERERKI